MPKPSAIACDSDVLVQIYSSCGHHLLRWIKSQYGVTPVIADAVNVEMRWVGRHKDAFEKELQKSLDGGVITIGDLQWAQSRISPSTAAQTVFDAYESLGNELNRMIGRGEAYTHALAQSFGVLACSNDQQAISVLTAAGRSVGAPIVRFFDLVCLAFQAGEFDDGACNSICKQLRRVGEGLPGEFEHHSFSDGLQLYVPRVIDSSRPLVGSSGAPSSNTGPASRLTLSPLVD